MPFNAAQVSHPGPLNEDQSPFLLFITVNCNFCFPGRIQLFNFQSIQGMPLTPESPEDRVPVTTKSKSSETVKENEESLSSLVNYNTNHSVSPALQ